MSLVPQSLWESEHELVLRQRINKFLRRTIEEAKLQIITIGFSFLLGFSELCFKVKAKIINIVWLVLNVCKRNIWENSIITRGQRDVKAGRFLYLTWNGKMSTLLDYDRLCMRKSRANLHKEIHTKILHIHQHGTLKKSFK